MLSTIKTSQITNYRLLTYFAGFLISFHIALTAYVNSAWLETFISENKVGLIFVVASLLLILFTFNEKILLKKFGDVRLTTFLVVSLIIVSFLIASNSNPTILVVAFVVFFALGALIKFNLDLYLENLSTNANTGLVRGLFLTCSNLAWLISPILATQMINRIGGYWSVYLASGLILLPLLVLTHYLRDPQLNQKPTTNQTEPVWQTIKKLILGKNIQNRNLRSIITIIFLLNFFYAVMVIYIPIYLLNHLNFSWPVIGKIFTLMLLPFVLIQYPLGRLSDKIGEKEVLFAGLFVMAMATFLIALTQSTSALVWAILLFSTRVGAATVEVMSDVYLFKKVDREAINVIALARNCYPASYVVAPILASIFLQFFPIQNVFLCLSLIVLMGTFSAWQLRDTNWNIKIVSNVQAKVVRRTKL